MTDRPNWGWGEHKPVPVFTEAEIRAVLWEHWPSPDYDVGVRCMGPDHDCHDWDVDHLIRKLKEAREVKTP